jgi:hypothetical protein
MSVAAQRGAIAGFCNGLLGRSHALTVSAHVAIPLRDNQILVCSAAASGLFRVTDNIQGSLDEYLDILRSQQFSAVLNDGGILQISYRYKRDKLIGHRLCFYPCPILFQAEELEDLQIEDFLDMLSEKEILMRIRTRPTLRFEYDPERSSEEHPTSHLHMAYEGCRIPVASPLSLSQFTTFIFKYFYPTVWENDPELRNQPYEYYDHEILETHRTYLHLTSYRSA